MKRHTGLVALILLSSIGAVACGPSDADVSADIDEIYREYEASILAGDPGRWVAQWSDDPVALWPNTPAKHGEADLLAGISESLELVISTQFEISPEEVEVAGDWAYARGTFVETAGMAEGGEPWSFVGKFLTIFQRQSDGSWKIHRDIYNSDLP